MSASLNGIHHVTAICSDPQRNLDFYVELLGLRLVKKTVNFDDPGTYHFYYGDGIGSPGTIMTFFAWAGLPPMVSGQGRQGTGQIIATSFSIPAQSYSYWIDRLAAAAVSFDAGEARFGEHVIAFQDPDGLPLELVAQRTDALRAPWVDGPVPLEHAIRGFAGATLCLSGYENTAELMTGTLGFREVGQEGSRFRFHAGKGHEAAAIDLLCMPEEHPGRMGIGVAHHIAWRTPSSEDQLRWRAVIADGGYDVTPVLDREYFESIYFREPGGVLFEIATDAPGFIVDEPRETLGAELKLPPWLEPRRERIEARLAEVHIPIKAARTASPFSESR